MCFIEEHHMKANIPTMTKTDLSELITILGIPRHLWTHKLNPDTQEPYELTYGFGDGDASAIIKLCNLKQGMLMNPKTRETQVTLGFDAFDHLEREEQGFEPYYGNKVYLQLHGDFFDHSRNCDYEQLTAYLLKLGCTFPELDLAYYVPHGIIELEEWLRVFGDEWKKHVTGNILKRTPTIKTQYDAGKFWRTEIGRYKKEGTKNGQKEKEADKKTGGKSYAVFYVRPDGMQRLELKVRNPLHNLKLMKVRRDKGVEAYRLALLDFLVTQLDIFTAESRRTKKPERYAREPFWSAFLASEPKKLVWKEEGKRKDDADRNLKEAADANISTILGRILSHSQKYASIMTGQEISATIYRGMECLRADLTSTLLI